MWEKNFPEELLMKSSQERKSYFEQIIIKHPKLDYALMDAKKKIINDRFPLLLLYGPSGVGKSTLLSQLQKIIIESIYTELETDLGRIPLISFEAKAPESIKFNWGDFFRSALLAIKEPCIDYKVIPPTQERDNLARFTSKTTISALRSSYESAIEFRKPLACFVDEAQHLAKIPKGSKLQDQMDVIKSISNITKTPHILAGTYEILNFRNQSAQLCNRSSDIHLSRYDVNDELDRENFRVLLLDFEDNMPVINVQLADHWRFLYERSIGCIGVLKKWLERALDSCLSDSNNLGAELSIKHLESTALSVKQCQKMVIEARDGEKALLESEDDRIQLLTSLGLHSLHQSVKTNTTAKKNSAPRRKPGQRKESRDPITSDMIINK